MIYHGEDLDWARFLYELGEQLSLAYSAHQKTRETAFQKWTGENRDTAGFLADDLDKSSTLLFHELEDRIEDSVLEWVNRVDGYNQWLYEKQVAATRQWLDYVRDSVRFDTVDKVVGSIDDFADWATNYRKDNPEDLVPRPKVIADYPDLRPTPPHFNETDVFVVYRFIGGYPPEFETSYGNDPWTSNVFHFNY